MVLGNKNEIWFSLITWLLQHNARKLVLIEETCNETNYNQFQKRFEILTQNYPDLTTMHLSSSCVNNKEEAIEMIRTANNLAPLDVVFCLSLVGNYMYLPTNFASEIELQCSPCGLYIFYLD